MDSDNNQHKFQTRYLGDQHANPMPDRTTNPLDHEVPSVLALYVLDHGVVLEFPLAQPVVLGRRDRPGAPGQADVDLTPFNAQENGVSRQHVVIAVQNGRVSIKDLNSMNGTFLNGYVLQPLHSYRLRHGDELTLGRLSFQVSFVVPEAGR